MAVERIREFVLDLSGLVQARLDSFVNSRQRIHATEEATFQRSVVDNDLSYQEQLDYRKAQLEKEKGETYPDNEFIDEIKTSVTGLRKMVRYRKFRDGYFTLLTDLASGRKSLEDHLEYLQSSLTDESLDREIKDELKEQYTKTLEAKRTQDRKIIDAQIGFNKKDRTVDSINKAIASVKSQLTKPDIQRDEVLRTSYELQLATLEKEKLEIGIEDEMNWMAINLMSKDRKNPSLWKLETFSGFRDKAGDTPVNIGGVRYASEQEYWQVTLNNYVQNDFGNEYVAENKGEGALIWNKMGILPDSYLKNLITNNNIIRAHPELADFQIVIASAIQDSITNALSLKAKDLTAKYYLDKPELATTREYEMATGELENLKVMFGADYSLSPEIQRVETLSRLKVKGLAKDIRERVADVMADPEAYGENLDITWEEALKKYGPAAGVEVSPEVYKKKTPLEAAEEEAEIGKKAGEKVEEKEAREEAAKPTPTPAAPAPAPTPTPAPRGELVHQTWTRITGKPWSAAKAGGYTTGSYRANISLQKKLLGGWSPYAKAAPTPKAKPKPKLKPKPKPTVSSLKKKTSELQERIRRMLEAKK